MGNFTNLNWEDLRYFQALAEKKTLTSAAKMTGVTHVTIARRVQHLETAIGYQLFDQKAVGFELTNSGEKIYRKVLDMAAQATSIQEAFKPEGIEGIVRLSTTPALCEYIIKHGFSEFHARHPNIRLEFFSEARNVSLAKHEAHLVLRLTRPETGDFVIRRVGKIDFGLYHSINIDRPDLVSSSIVGYTEELDHLPESKWLSREFPNNKFIFRSNSLQCHIRAIESGLGIGLLPKYLAHNSRLLKQSHGVEMPTSRGIWLIMREAFKDVPRIRITADYLVEFFKKKRLEFENDEV